MAFFALYLGFFLGAAAVLVVEGLALYLIIDRLRRKATASLELLREPQEPRVLDTESWLASACNKQGIVWFLEPERVPKVSSFTSQLRGPKEMKKKKGIIEVQPIKKYAKIKDRFLILSDPDGAEVDIKLMNYNIFAVSASNVLTKKWAKRYPIRLESKGSGVHDGNKTFYLYLDNAWEKESWCKALRLASFHDNKMINWYDQLSKEFNQYMTSFSSEFPSFLKPSAFSGEGVEKNIRVDGPSASSKVRVLLKKLAKRASKGGIESRPYSVLSSSREERKSETSFSSSDGSVKSTLEDKSSSFMLQDPVHLGSKVQSPVMPDAVWDDKLFGDDGTLCWNLLLSRFFFDAKRSAEMNNFVKSRIQKTLSNMRTPSYIGEIACTNIDLGNLPPYIHKIRVLPMDLTEVWTVEVDIEYVGGILVEIETRIEVCETELQEEFMNDSSELNCNVDASSLLEGIEYYSNQLKSSSNSADHSEKGNEGGEVDGLQQFKGATQAQVGRSKWKNILHTIAEQVSQVIFQKFHQGIKTTWNHASFMGSIVLAYWGLLPQSYILMSSLVFLPTCLLICMYRRRRMNDQACKNIVCN